MAFEVEASEPLQKRDVDMGLEKYNFWTCVAAKDPEGAMCMWFTPMGVKVAAGLPELSTRATKGSSFDIVWRSDTL